MRRTTQRGSSRSISALGRCQEYTCQIDCPGKPPLIFGSTPRTPLIGIHGEKKRFAEPEKRTSPPPVSVGYAACHWCHVMAHESFENPDIARLMNERFINIKVDCTFSPPGAQPIS
jgi:hypothetical protein